MAARPDRSGPADARPEDGVDAVDARPVDGGTGDPADTRSARTALASARDILAGEVRLLGALLGEVISEQAGDDLLALVERTRRRSIEWRETGDVRIAEQLAAELRELPADRASGLAHAFALYFQLINLAEERDAVRRVREAEQAAERPLEGSLEDAVLWLTERDWTADRIEALLASLRISPVLTAHPTEARRRTLLVALRRCYRLVEQLDDPRLAPREEAEIRRRLREEVSILWRSAVIREERPTPLDEVRTALTFFDETIFRVVPRVYRLLDHALDPVLDATAKAAVPGDTNGRADPDANGAGDRARKRRRHSGTRPPLVPAFLQFGSWIGGDRDGNPNVTAEITRQVPRIQADHVLRGYEAVASRLVGTLAVAVERNRVQPPLEARLARDADDLPETMRDLGQRFPHEPYRRRMGAIAERLRRTRAYLTELAGPVGGRYERPGQLVAELGEIQQSLVADGLARVAYGEVQDLRWQVETFGFHLASLELRQHSEVHQAAVDAIRAADAAGDPVDTARELIPGVTLGEVLASFRVMASIQRRFGDEACHTLIVSFTRGARDVLNVLELARRAGDPSITSVATGGLAPATPVLDVVPLFESADALEGCVEIMETLLADEGYRRHLVSRGNRQQVLIGYSDSNKENGFLASMWMLYRTAGSLAEVVRAHGVELTLFHGRGGAIGRGGGPTNRAILAQAPRSVAGRFKLTEQGETIATNYANLDLAERHLEVVSGAAIIASAEDHDECVDEVDARGRATMDELAAAAREAYRALVYDEPEFARFFGSITPIAELSTMALGSRPAKRAGGGGTGGGSSGSAASSGGSAGGGRAGAGSSLDIEKLRAIPWVFSWAQARIGLPGWYGLGSAIEAYERAHGDAARDRLVELYRDWPFLSSALDNAEFGLARVEPQIAALYADLAADDAGRELWRRILDEFERTKAALSRVTGRAELLASEPDARRSVRLRRPYIDPLSYLQVGALSRLRALSPDDPEAERLRRLVQVTINGVAAGLQSTG